MDWRVLSFLLLALLVLLGSSSGLLSSLLQSALSLSAGVEIELSGVFADGLDSASISKLLDEGAGNGSVNLELFHEGGAGDNEDFGDFLAHLEVALLIEENIVVELVLDLNLGPGLLFGTFLLSTTLLGGLRAFGGGLSCVFTTLLLLGLPQKESERKTRTYHLTYLIIIESTLLLTPLFSTRQISNL